MTSSRTLSTTSCSVSVDLLDKNIWNPNRMDRFMFEKALASIREFGFVDPVTVRPKGTRYEIVDGEHRWRAAVQLGYTEVPVVVIDGLGDADAKKLTIVLNETRGRSAPDALGELLRGLAEAEPLEALLAVLPYTAESFGKLVELSAFDWGAPAATVTAASPASHWVERTYRVPREVAEVLDEALAKAKRQGAGEIEWQALEAIAADYLAG